MSNENNCMFQYATRNEVISNTDLITQKDAVDLFNKYKPDFIESLEGGHEPEMCIWIDCDTNASYGKTLYHWCACDFKVIDGEIYQKL